MSELPIAPVKRLLKSTGSFRVSEDAAICLSEALEQEGSRIAMKASRYAKHAGRSTIKLDDVKLALKD